MAERATPPPLARAGIIAIGVVLLQALLMLWFAWPAKNTAPRDVPVLVAGPAPAAASLAGKLGAESSLKVTTVPDAAAADAALRDRAAYAAFVVGPAGVTLHVASAASPTVALLLTQAAQQLGNGATVPVADVVASPVDDPRGAGFASAFLPLLLTSIAAGIALLFVVRSHAVRLIGVIAFAALAGLLASGVMHGLGLLAGSYWSAAGAIALLTLAMSATVSGLGALLGNPGIGLGVLLVFVLGNPISGLASAPELLPKPWGAIGQYLPPGAGSTLLRGASFFDWAGTGVALWVLLAWGGVGLGLTAVGHFRDRAARNVTAARSVTAAAPA
jgi:hypothetical protein